MKNLEMMTFQKILKKFLILQRNMKDKIKKVEKENLI